MGVAYRYTPYCSVDVAIGDTWWRFVDPTKWPEYPPPGIFENVGDPAPMPGIVILSSTDRAVFRADVDRSVLALVRIDVPEEAGCL